MKTIRTIESDKYEKAEDGIHIRHVGMISGMHAFELLEKHLTEVGLLPDEYFLPSLELSSVQELPEFRTAICHTDWGGSEGIYIDISLLYTENYERKSMPFATGKTLAESGDAFLKMSRIAAECSMMLNGRGELVKFSEQMYDFGRDISEAEKGQEKLNVRNEQSGNLVNERPSLDARIESAKLSAESGHSCISEDLQR